MSDYLTYEKEESGTDIINYILEKKGEEGKVIMYLKDIIKATCKEDYKERFKTEYYHTKERYERLKDLNNKIEAYG